MRRASFALLALPATALFLATACSSTQDDDRGPEGDTASKSSRVLQPGRPGEPNATLDADDVAVAESLANGQDANFVQMMIPHHAQALKMAELAQRRAEDERVLSFARRIKGAQGPEILTLRSWLEVRDLEVPETMWEHGGHHDTGMPGMLRPRGMRQLAASTGASFDRLFLSAMIRHHRGAVLMAEEQLTAGAEQVALEMAAEIGAGQEAEITRMREVLADL